MYAFVMRMQKDQMKIIAFGNLYSIPARGVF